MFVKNQATKGFTGRHHTLETKEKLRLKNIGRTFSEESIQKIKNAKDGNKNPNWKGGIYPKHMLIRQSIENRNWIKQIFERDKYTCQECGKVGGFLNAHHIKQFAYYPTLRFDLSNGITLCRECHNKPGRHERKTKMPEVEFVDVTPTDTQKCKCRCHLPLVTTHLCPDCFNGCPTDTQTEGEE